MYTYSALILDDEEFSVEVLLEDIAWQDCGISQVNGVYSVRQAKEFLKKNPTNILICDIEMPGENGLDLVEWAMEYARFSKDPMVCIMLTCHPEYSFLRKAMQLGCQDYLLKPVDEEDLEASLKKAVGVLNALSMKATKDLPKEPESGRDIIRQKVLPYIQQNLTEPFTVSQLADSVSLNPQYMMRLFKKETDMSILEYVTEQRILKAKELLLSTDNSIETIGMQLGYYNYTYFMKVFKRSIGMSPGQYRKQYGK